MRICVTEVDAVTKIPCTVEPQRTGPSFPEIKGLEYKWANESTWPVEVAPDGTYLRAPKYYCFCDDDANINVAGVLEVLTEAEWIALEIAEMEARKPYPSWVWDEATQSWVAPVPYPTDGKEYYWDETTESWVLYDPQSYQA